MPARSQRLAVSVFLVVVFTTLALSPVGSLAPTAVSAQAPIEPSARPAGGTAYTGLGTAVRGVPLDKPPAKPLGWEAAIQREPLQEPTTPIDLSAPLNYGPPTVPDSRW